MSKTRVYLFDTTLRDGAQTSGVDFSVEDKRQIALALDSLGLDYVEGGWPGANPTDTAFFDAPPTLKHAIFTAFGMTKRAGVSAENDPTLSPILNAKAGAGCLVGKSHDYQVDVALGIPREENLVCIRESIAAVAARGKEAMLDAEHFFDGYKANSDYALQCLEAAFDGGARWAVLCDTNGGTLPSEVYRIVREVTRRFPGERLGVHTHNDTENAVANTLAAVEAGVCQIQGTLNGLGERTGNANILSLIATLALKEPYRSTLEIGVDAENLKRLVEVSRLLDEILNRAPNRHQPYVGASAFAHKGGLHASAVLKDPKTYEHVPPESVGNARKILVSDQAGRSNVLTRLEQLGIAFDPKDARIKRLLDDVKEREFLGYAYEGADASFELLARRALGQVPDYFKVEGYRVLVERRFNARGELTTVSEATVKTNVHGRTIHSVGEGNGPVDALDDALRKDLGGYSKVLEDLRLVDYKVRILTSGTEAVTRVLIESADGEGRRWSTVGVSPNIVDASFEALADSITYKLLRDGHTPL
ncbi:MAG: citramalate synthase [Alphaproteobacteria bacterium]|nr:citramalate synthase [Alphaproteobacteria bacterium]